MKNGLNLLLRLSLREVNVEVDRGVDVRGGVSILKLVVESLFFVCLLWANPGSRYCNTRPTRGESGGSTSMRCVSDIKLMRTDTTL